MGICHGGERKGRYYSEEFGVWYDLYRCDVHGYHADVNHDRGW